MSNIEEVEKGWKSILEKSKASNYIVVVGASSGTDVQYILRCKAVLPYCIHK